ncbi:cellobiose-binding protein [Isoptericola jiangsuensis]|uniref:Cellobiose-binding protein n=1 Tax=Isoptericola jiangsuensis TaxID=548579 RepID=A0A2A9EY80_9MICO|nr:ABC transporter substrate-binding protein [Isoptericola jiangsuensis]PFG44107.1 cellobiose-binding protein [Isoptericola jiangsuensis]
MLSSTRPRQARRVAAATAGIASLAIVLTACSSDAEPTSEGSTSADEDITLTVATFNNFGYTDELLQQYMDENPNVTVKHVTAAESADARTNLTTKLAAGGEGLADIEAIEVDWLPELMQYPDLFTDLTDAELDGRWVDWKVAQATTPDGKLIGYGTDIGPEAICYRSDLLEAAGLPSERDEVAEWIGGDSATWDSYFAAGKEYVEATGNAWYDGAVATFQGMINQVDAAYEDPSTGEPKDLASNTEVKDLYDQLMTASVDDKLSAGLEQWGDDWAAGFQNDAFATMLCPAWMTGPIEQNAGNVEGWDIADVFPGGGGNWGGSFLTVPASGAHTDAAKQLAAWLTSPEVQTQAFTEAGTFPSQLEAQGSEEVQSFVNEFMNEAPAGAIFSARAQAITGNPFKGPNYFAIHTEVQNAINRVDLTGDDPEKSWEQAVAEVPNVIQ